MQKLFTLGKRQGSSQWVVALSDKQHVRGHRALVKNLIVKDRSQEWDELVICEIVRRVSCKGVPKFKREAPKKKETKTNNAPKITKTIANQARRIFDAFSGHKTAVPIKPVAVPAKDTVKAPEKKTDEAVEPKIQKPKRAYVRKKIAVSN